MILQLLLVFKTCFWQIGVVNPYNFLLRLFKIWHGKIKLYNVEFEIDICIIDWECPKTMIKKKKLFNTIKLWPKLTHVKPSDKNYVSVSLGNVFSFY